MDFHVFLSYRRVDKNIARMIKESLERKGYRVFLDMDELQDGYFDERILQAMNSAPVFMILMTENAFGRCENETDWVRQEIEYALTQKKHIIPLAVDKRFSGFPANCPPSIASAIEKLQYSAIDTGQLYQSSIDLLVKQRLQPVLGKGRLAWRRYVVMVSCVLGLMALLLGGYVLFRSNRHSLPADEMVDLADSLCSVKVCPKQLISRGEDKRIINMYREAAPILEEEGNAAQQSYSSARQYDDVYLAYYSFHTAGYAWQCIEEYEKSIEDYRKAVSLAKIIAEKFPADEHTYAAAYAMNNLAYSYFYHGDTLLALRTIDDAINCNSEILEYYDSKGELLYLAHRYEEAWREWEYMLSRDPYYERNYWVDSCAVRVGL